MRIGVGNDHAAIELKNEIVNHLIEKGIEVINYGINEGEKVDYPLIAEEVSKAVVSKEVDYGIVMCGTGIGVSISANKVKGIRACACSEPYSAKLSKEHNNTNVLCFGSRVVGSELAKMIVDEWLNAEFLGDRHLRRVDLIKAMEE